MEPSREPIIACLYLRKDMILLHELAVVSIGAFLNFQCAVFIDTSLGDCYAPKLSSPLFFFLFNYFPFFSLLFFL